MFLFDAICATQSCFGFYPGLLFFLEVGDVCGRIQRPAFVVSVRDAV